MTTTEGTRRNGIAEHRAFVDALSQKSLAVEEPYREPETLGDILEHALGKPKHKSFDPRTHTTTTLTFAL